jgi:Protein of unknown function (DUF1549)
MNPTPPNRPDHNPLSEADERAIDALIDEVQQFMPAPPDLSVAILRQLANRDWDHQRSNSSELDPTIAITRSRSESAVVIRRRRSFLISIAGALTIAASALLLLSRWEHTPINGNPIANSNKNTAATDAAIVPGSHSVPESEPRVANAVALDETKNAPAAIVKKPLPREGVPLVRNQPTPESANPLTSDSADAVVIAKNPNVLVEHGKLLVGFNDSIANYWNRLGVTPAASLNDSELAARVKEQFGASPELTSQEDCSQVAVRLVERLLRDVPLAAAAHEKMLEQATEVIWKGDRFDVLISQWVADQSLFDSRKPDQVAQGFATNLLGVDAACARCHDSPVDGRYAQHDYWSLASVFAPAERSQLFYELADGRQAVAEPRLPERWLGESRDIKQHAELELRQQFSQALVGNRALAGALANRIWEIGFGAPLVSVASDPIAPPRDDALQNAHAMIADAILASNFDIRVAARLVMASDAMRRGQSELYTSGRWRVASDEAIAQEALSQRTFAAAPPQQPRLSRDHLLAMMESRIGQTPRELGSSPAVLAQPSISDSVAASGVAKVEKPRAEEYLWAQWIADRQLLRDSWLHWIKDAEQQQRHSLYAVNMKSNIDETELPKRLMSPSDDESIAADNANDRLLWVLRKSR